MLYIIIAILMFGILIALHEFGHFITAKLLGVRVNEFAIGMGPLLFSTQKGETQYSLRAIPMGGFCAMEGEDDASDDPRAFSNKPAWRKFIILVAGSFMNFLTGFVLLALLLAQNTFFVVPVIDTLMEGFPYESAQGLLPGDRIVRVNGERIYTKSDLDLFFGRDEDGIMDLVIERDGVRLERPGFDLRPREYTYEGKTVQMRGLICVREPFHVGNWLRQSWYNTIDMVRMVRLSLVDHFSGRAGIQDMSGPIGIVTMMSDVGAQSPNMAAALANILWFVAFIAINLAVMNLLPIPALDGGRIFFLAVNGLFSLLTRRKLDPKYEGYVNMAGFCCLILLMVVVAFNDIVKLFA